MQRIPNDNYRMYKYMALMSIYSVLDLTSKGFSVGQITKRLNISEEEVLDSLGHVTGYKGLKLPIDKSPIMLYNNVNKDRNKFVKLFEFMPVEEAEELYNFLVDFENFRKELDDLDNAITRL